MTPAVTAHSRLLCLSMLNSHFPLFRHGLPRISPHQGESKVLTIFHALCPFTQIQSHQTHRQPPIEFSTLWLSFSIDLAHFTGPTSKQNPQHTLAAVAVPAPKNSEFNLVVVFNQESAFISLTALETHHTWSESLLVRAARPRFFPDLLKQLPLLPKHWNRNTHQRFKSLNGC